MVEKKLKPTHILYAADEDGYTVRVMEGNETVDEYNSGNNPFESTSWIDPADLDAVPVRTLRRYARETALDMAQEHGIPEKYVSENEDLLPIAGA